MNITIQNQNIACNVQYSKRKKVSIQLDPNGLLTVKAPNGTPEDAIIRLVEQHSEWVLDNLRRLSSRQPAPEARAYEDYGTFMYLGREHKLEELIETTDADEDMLRNRLKKFYFSSCKKVINQRIAAYQQQLKVKPKSIDIVESTTKWGSCSFDKKLTFNYRLAMAPVEVIDYVIVHELCHLLHMNHDRSFWRKVGGIMPDYKEKEEYLARYGRYMTL
ncbi:M48 family metallopeptidase [Paenibacillus dauci]|uniref:M48 family metallopeptidase n=1 Tax=Paenibacillus dauci TaxID=1567106 RepID=UPI0006194EED|nr:SprT family zinc-dependent metalloprotease [Paenibacillus dauci]